MIERFFSGIEYRNRPVLNTLSTDGQQKSLSSGASILLIDDNPTVTSALAITLQIAGHQLNTAASPEEAFSRLAIRQYDAILLDMNFTAGMTNGDEGLACLERIIADDPHACIVVITAHSGIRIAVAAMQAGARDFVMKPWRNADLVAKVEAAITRTSASAHPTFRSGTARDAAALLGDSPAMIRVRELIARVGPTAASVAVTGRSGTGRTMTALALLAKSSDVDAPPARIDLRDAASWNQLERLSGTAILRHPDCLDLVSQDRLLDQLPSDLRCITIADSVTPLVSKLRRRIATVEIGIPPLCNRGADTLILARHFAREAAKHHARPDPSLTPAAEAAIGATAWPDEVRGLALAVERAILLSDDSIIDASALMLHEPLDSYSTMRVEAGFDLTNTEKAVIEAALREHRHNVSHAASALGLSRGALYRRMARHGL